MVTYDYSGKTVLIYGGTTGIGRASAKAFAASGAKVFVSGIGAADGKSLVDEIRGAGQHDVEFIEADVSRDADVRKAMDMAVKRFGRIHVAFNNAGEYWSETRALSFLRHNT